jgi:hypothetical protein
MSFINATKFTAIDVPYIDRNGREVVIAIVKETFEVDEAGRIHRAECGSEIRAADEPYDPTNVRGSLRYPSDVCEEKVGTDVVVVGEAVLLRPAPFVDVGIRVRDVLVPMRVHGPRIYYRGSSGVVISPAAPFERMPVVYERAYGGATEDWSVVEERNPAGVGVAKRDVDLIHTPAPQIEHPAKPHARASDRHQPVGCGAIMSHWSPRREHVGTVDELWKETRMPLMPLDFNIRFNNIASPSLIFEEPLTAGDAIAVAGMSPKPLVFTLPSFPVIILGIYAQSPKISARPHIDTLLIEPGERRFELIARCALKLGRGRDSLREVRVDVQS